MLTLRKTTKNIYNKLMDFTVRNTQESDYEMLCEWWRMWRWTPVDRLILPDNIESGLMVSYEGVELCSGFVYKTSSSSLYWIEFIVSNPNVKDREVRKEGLKFLVNGLIFMSEQLGAKAIYSSLVNGNLKQTYMDCGFVEGSKGAIQMIRTF